MPAPNQSSSQILKLESTPAKSHAKKKDKKSEPVIQYSFTLCSQLFETQAFGFIVDACSIAAKPGPRTIERDRFLCWLESIRELTAIPAPAKIFGASPNMGYTKPTDELPEIIQKSFQYVEANALNVEGIYRLSGAAAKVAEYVEQFNAGKFVNFDQVCLTISHNLCYAG